MPGTIVIVDDEPDMLMLLKIILTEKTDYQVLTTSDPNQALEWCRENHADLLISDLRMPEIGGIELLKMVKELDPNLALIIITAFGTVESAVEAMRYNAFDYITKPFRKEQILTTVEKALRWRQRPTFGLIRPAASFLLGNILKIFDFLKRKKSVPPEGWENYLKQKHESFKDLLDANNAALRIMSRMDAKLAGDFVFDMEYIRSRTEMIFQACQTLIEQLNALGDNRYAELVPVFANIKIRIEEEIQAGTASGEKIPLVLPLSQVDRRLLMAVGGKNANLGEIKNRLHLPTPDGFVLTIEAYHLVLAENGLAERVGQILEKVDVDDVAHLLGQSRRLRVLVLAAEIPSQLSGAVHEQYLQLAGRLGYEPQLALRSSGLYEDQELSFAGQFLTVLNVPAPDFFPNYLKVLASQFSPSALVYLHEKGLLRQELAMSVGCLAMVPARASGVLFTVDPLGGRADAMVLDAAWGLGPSVVEGALTPDHFILAKKPQIKVLERRPGNKPVRLIATPDKGGLTSEAVPAADQRQPALTTEELLQVGSYGAQLEEYFGRPQDIEFAVDREGRLLLLQSRPLTLLQPESESELPPAIEDRHPVLIDHGSAACFGVAAGPVFIIRQDEDLASFPRGRCWWPATLPPTTASCSIRRPPWSWTSAAPLRIWPSWPGNSRSHPWWIPKRPPRSCKTGRKSPWTPITCGFTRGAWKRC